MLARVTAGSIRDLSIRRRAASQYCGRALSCFSFFTLKSLHFRLSSSTWTDSTDSSTQNTEGLSNYKHTHTHTHPFNGPLSGTTRVSRYQKGKTDLDFTEARDSEWQWHQLGHMQVCTSLQTNNYASTPPLKVFLQAGQTQTHRHTYRQTDSHAHHNTPLHYPERLC